MSSYQERQKNLFNLLKDAEEQCNFNKQVNIESPNDYGAIDKTTYRKVKKEMKQFRGRESIFKRTPADIKKCLQARSMPDYMKNPQKWVYYSLSDVTPEQMSDATNLATALACIQKLEEENIKSVKEEKDDDDGTFKKPTFRISATMKKANSQVDEEKPIIKSNKIVMPEYIVGVSHKKEKKEKIVKRLSKEGNTENKNMELKLKHLYEDED